jgi:hypothetical protein
MHHDQCRLSRLLQTIEGRLIESLPDGEDRQGKEASGEHQESSKLAHEAGPLEVGVKFAKSIISGNSYTLIRSLAAQQTFKLPIE